MMSQRRASPVETDALKKAQSSWGSGLIALGKVCKAQQGGGSPELAGAAESTCQAMAADFVAEHYVGGGQVRALLVLLLVLVLLVVMVALLLLLLLTQDLTLPTLPPLLQRLSFKPTKASVTPWRSSAEQSVSYFTGGQYEDPGMSGFARAGWTKVRCRRWCCLWWWWWWWWWWWCCCCYWCCWC